MTRKGTGKIMDLVLISNICIGILTNKQYHADIVVDFDELGKWIALTAIQ
jgi:hypothetical protein